MIKVRVKVAGEDLKKSKLNSEFSLWDHLLDASLNTSDGKAFDERVDVNQYKFCCNDPTVFYSHLLCSDINLPNIQNHLRDSFYKEIFKMMAKARESMGDNGNKVEISDEELFNFIVQDLATTTGKNLFFSRLAYTDDPVNGGKIVSEVDAQQNKGNRDYKDWRDYVQQKGLMREKEIGIEQMLG